MLRRRVVNASKYSHLHNGPDYSEEATVQLLAAESVIVELIGVIVAC